MTRKPSGAPTGPERRVFPPRNASPGLATILLFLAGLSLPLEPAASGGDWPQWRGPRRDGHAAPDETLPATLPPALDARWRLPVGGGFASPVVANEKLFFVDDQDNRETAHAFDPSTGRELWRTAYGESFADEWGQGPRCTPIANDGRLFVQSAKGEFACLDQKDGRRLWGFSFERDFHVRFLGGNDSSETAARRRGNSGAPLIVGDRIFVAVGSTNGATVVCFDKHSGSELWRSGTDEAGYAALNSGTLAGGEQLVAYTAFGLLGLSLDGGPPLWRTPLRTAANRHAVTPIFHGDDIIVSSHTIGLRALRVRRTGSALATDESWAAPDLKISLATLVLLGDHLYGQGPDRNLVCVDANRGTVKWSQPGYGDKPLTGYSSTLAAGRRLLVLSEDGQLALLEADPERYRELSRQQVCGRNWSHPALAGGVLYLRDQRSLMAFPMKGEK